MEINRAAIFNKLNDVGYQCIEAATILCKTRGNPYVELEHWLYQLLQLQNSDTHAIIKAFEMEPPRLAKDLMESLDKLPKAGSSHIDLSSDLMETVVKGWTYATLMFGEPVVRSGYLLVGILKTDSLARQLHRLSAEFKKIDVDRLVKDYDKICGNSPEAGSGSKDGFRMGGGGAPGAEGEGSPAAMGKGEALAKFTVDWTDKARNGEIDPIVGRDEEIRQIIDILMRRRQNHPILTGEAGVGKTAVVEGFAHRIANDEVPPPLQGVALKTLDIGLLQAGASMKGEFEKRLRQVIDEVQASEQPIIMFIDEAHTLIGAGGAAGTGDAANLLKPALARGTLRTIAATTWAEYKKHIEKDPALTRRFQVIQVAEPTEDKGILMMRAMASMLEKHHKVQILDEALEASVVLSHRYIPARQLPDKSVSLLDTSCARVAISQDSVPAEIEDTREMIKHLNRELEIIANEKAIGVNIKSRATDATEKLEANEEKLKGLDERFEKEKVLIDEILDLRAKLRGAINAVEGTGSDAEQAADAEADPEREARIEKLRGLQTDLTELQGENPLIFSSVDYQAVASVVGDWTGIPVGRMVKNEVENVLKLADTLNERVVGQKHALDMIASRIKTSRASLDNPNKPIGVFMLAGPSGVGKTETALALAEALYGGEQNLITINMSEFQEAHTVSTLKGAPPGYVGYGEGGVLTEAVRRNPYSVVLLDEVEKAHTDVHEIFFQVFDKGVMEDGEGRMIDFKNTLILLTTNVGSDLIMNMCKDPELMPEPEGIAQALREPALKIFPAALLGRLVMIPYYPLSTEVVGIIARLQLGRIQKRIAENHKVPFTYDDAVIDLIVSRSTDLESGGRMIDNILTNTVLPTISQQFLEWMMAGKELEKVHVIVE
ncbi:MAG: type VI secretion system ATPase TssH, partial [Planctomycetales bacterium]